MTKALLFQSIGLALLLATHSQAAGFDCDKAKTRLEKDICKDPLISRLDDTLTNEYALMKDSVADPVAFRNQQRTWLSNLRKSYKSGYNLASAYRTRLAAIRKTPGYGWKVYTNAALGITIDYPDNRVLSVNEETRTLYLSNALGKEEDFELSVLIKPGSLEAAADSTGFEKRKTGWFYPNGRCGEGAATAISGPGWKGVFAETYYGTEDEAGFHACAGSSAEALISNGRVSAYCEIPNTNFLDLYKQVLQTLKLK